MHKKHHLLAFCAALALGEAGGALTPFCSDIRTVRDALPRWQQNLVISFAAWAAGVPF